MMERSSRPSLAAAVALAAVLAGHPAPAAAQVRQVERPATEVTRVTPIAPAAQRSRGYTTSVPGAVSLRQNPEPGAGLNPGWLAALQFPRGHYVVFASATFSRSGGTGTVAVICSLEGLDRTYTVEFNINPTDHQPDPSVTIPFNVAGTGAGVHLKCGGNATEVSAGNIVLNAIAVDELHRQ